MNNNCTSLLLLVALLSYNNNSCGCNNCNNCNNCNCDCGCNNCGCNNCGNNNGLFGNNAGMLCLLLAFLSSANCPLATSV